VIVDTPIPRETRCEMAAFGRRQPPRRGCRTGDGAGVIHLAHRRLRLPSATVGHGVPHGPPATERSAPPRRHSRPRSRRHSRSYRGCGRVGGSRAAGRPMYAAWCASPYVAAIGPACSNGAGTYAKPPAPSPPYRRSWTYGENGTSFWDGALGRPEPSVYHPARQRHTAVPDPRKWNGSSTRPHTRREDPAFRAEQGRRRR
jgi:hypothetical protein